jgi:hypothetical protein
MISIRQVRLNEGLCALHLDDPDAALAYLEKAAEFCDDDINNGTSGFCASDCLSMLP